MWDLGNRSVVALVSVLSGCVFLYNIWGPILILTISLFLTIYACYSLIVNDSLLSPHAFLLFDYCKRVSLEICAIVKSTVHYAYQYIRRYWKIASRRFRERHLTQFRMERRRGAHYQLSNDSNLARRNSSEYGSIAQFSPISKDVQQTDISNSISSKNKLYNNSGYSSYDHSPLGKHISTPLFPRNKEESENETTELLYSNQAPWKKTSPAYRKSHTQMQEDTVYCDRSGAVWSTSINPKKNADTNDPRVTSTIGGPLLSSSRYNIDQRVYNDVTSPGLTTRLTKYAAEANNKLIHQSRYRVGEFPKVNLHASPVPLIDAKSVRAKTPVTVRVAPPHTIRYSSPSVSEALREISLKRHASREDVASDLAKKQRTESVNNKEFDTLDETKQKRSREESLKSEEDSSPQSKTDRPTKRTKTPSCYDIINSLSSSKHVASGVKRKARDFSRSGTPDFEKHFKSLESIQSNNSHSLAIVENASPKHQEVSEKRNSGKSISSDKMQGNSPIRGILKTANKSFEIDSNNTEVPAKRSNSYEKKNRSEELAVSVDTAKLTHKLFMKAEPERNEKLRMLVEEQGNIAAKFTTDDVEEIKKEDIADMRQTSMKARLKSMFDAISGKAASQINPDVVIQAEEVNAIKSDECPVTCATLNSSTTTTNVNTTPISTSAVAPSLVGTNQSSAKHSKHVVFNIPNKEGSSNATAQNNDVFETQPKSVTPSTPNQTSSASESMLATTAAIVSRSPVSIANANNSNSTSANFDFGKSSPKSVSNASFGTLFASNAVSSSSVTPSIAASTATSPFGDVASSAAGSLTVPATSSTINANIETPHRFATNVSQTAQNFTTGPNLQLGSGNALLASTRANITPSSTTSVAQTKESGTGSTSIASTASSIPLNAVSASTVSTGPTVQTFAASSAPLYLFGNKQNSAAPSKAEGFSFSSTGNVSQSSNAFGSLGNSQQLQSTSASASTNTVASTGTYSGTNTNSMASQSSSVPHIAIGDTTLESNIKTTAAAAVTFGSPAISTFTFRAANSTTSGSTNKPEFSFGNVSNTVKVSNAESTNANAFSTGNNSLPSFGSLPTNNNASQFALNSSSIFGNASGSSIFGSTTANQPIFGTPSTANTNNTAFTAPKSTATPMFGSSVKATSVGFPTMSTAPVFSNTAGGPPSAATCAPAVPVFGSTVNTSAPSITGTTGNLFTGASSTVSTATFGPTSNIFGQATASSGNFKNTAGMFGSNSGAPSLFGSQTNTVSTFGTTNAISSNNTGIPVFGSASVPSNVAVPVFGTGTGTGTVATTGTTATSTTAATATASASAFVSQNATSSATPAAIPSTFGGGSSIFGTNNATNPPVFGTTASSPFGSSIASTFGGQNASGSSAFGTLSNVNATSNTNVNTDINANANANNNANANSVSAFGDNKVLPFGSQAPSFASSNPPNTAFGPVNNSKQTNQENNNAGSIFTFGANQKQQQQQQQQQPPQNTTFTFGSNNNASNTATTSTSAPFQFGGTTSTGAATGFNFSAPTTTPTISFGTTSAPSFNAATPGMFSIGSGFTAPRYRNARSRKPR